MTTFKQGDYVVITPTDQKYYVQQWNGFVAIVKDGIPSASNKIWLIPTVARPDGMGMNEFVWSADELSKIEGTTTTYVDVTGQKWQPGDLVSFSATADIAASGQLVIGCKTFEFEDLMNSDVIEYIAIVENPKFNEEFKLVGGRVPFRVVDAVVQKNGVIKIEHVHIEQSELSGSYAKDIKVKREAPAEDFSQYKRNTLWIDEAKNKWVVCREGLAAVSVHVYKVSDYPTSGSLHYWRTDPEATVRMVGALHPAINDDGMFNQ